MKKVLALLLVLCMAVGLMACTGTPNPTDPSEDPKPSESQSANNPDPTESTAAAKPYAGKTLQVWGTVQDTHATYGDIANLEKAPEGHNYIWFHLAAIKEWAAINDATVEFIGSYNQNAMLAAMNGGDKPDVIQVLYNQWPVSRNLGIVKAMTAEQRAEIDDIIGSTQFTDLISKGDTAYGYVMPWQGVETIWFNLNLFETYGKKTPFDYILEDNWTWETLAQCMRDMTIDLNGDGDHEIYGMDLRGLSRMLPEFAEDENGKLLNIIDSERQRDYITLIYNALQDGSCKALNYTYERIDYPRPAMFIGDGGVDTAWALEDNRFLSNGELLARCPTPIRSKEDPYHVNCITSIYWAMGAATDEPEAAFDLLKYITKCGMAYRYRGYDNNPSPYPVPKYEGLTGACDYSKRFLECVEKGNKINQAGLDKIEMTEERKKIFELINKPFNEDPYFIGCSYAGVSSYLNTAKNYENPPASMIAALKPTLDSQIATYNDLYVY